MSADVGRGTEKVLVALTQACCVLATLAPASGNLMPGPPATSRSSPLPAAPGARGSNVGSSVPFSVNGAPPLVCYNYALDCSRRSDNGTTNVRCDGDEVRYCPPDPGRNANGYANTFCKIFWVGHTVVLKGCHIEANGDCRRNACVGTAGATVRQGFCCCNSSLCNTDFLLPSAAAAVGQPPAQRPPAQQRTTQAAPARTVSPLPPAVVSGQPSRRQSAQRTTRTAPTRHTSPDARSGGSA